MQYDEVALRASRHLLRGPRPGVEGAGKIFPAAPLHLFHPPSLLCRFCYSADITVSGGSFVNRDDTNQSAQISSPPGY